MSREDNDTTPVSLACLQCAEGVTEKGEAICADCKEWTARQEAKTAEMMWYYGGEK